MEPSILHRQISTFEERNTFLYFVLGLISVSSNFIHRLESEQDKLNGQSDLQNKNGPDEPSVSPLRDLLI
jgi:hypothetical protein